MSPVLTPPLRRLLLLRLRGGWRKQLARLQTPRGILMAAVGALIFGAWIASLFLRGSAREGLTRDALELRLGIVALSFTVITLAGALRFRGLFLPREEIERLFSAPLSRPELVRYRLCASGLRSLFGGSLVALGAARMFDPWFAFPATLVALSTLTVLHQFAAITFGRLEIGLGRWLRRGARVATALGLLALAVLLGAFFSGVEPRDFPLVGELAASLTDPQGAVGRMAWIFRPWTRPIVATSAAEFLPWFLLDLVLLAGLFEATARLPFDFRELSLDTSASIAARLRRRRQVGGAAGGEADVGHARAVPWLFSRGPTGAIAWRKTASMLRKARSTFAVALVVIALVLFLGVKMDSGPGPDAVPVLVAVIGTVYLCSGLRFDFREDLERMEAIKAWPLAPERIFVGMLLPETVLVTVLMMVVVVAQAVLRGELQPMTLGCLALLPPFVFGWIALDNAVFLFAPVRAVPGQEGVLQNAGRTALLMLARLVLLGAAGVVGVAAFLAARFLGSVLGGSQATAAALGLGAAWVAVVLEDVALVWIGGACLRRFDVARDRG
jgi:hypothetical protein